MVYEDTPSLKSRPAMTPDSISECSSSEARKGLSGEQPFIPPPLGFVCVLFVLSVSVVILGVRYMVAENGEDSASSHRYYQAFIMLICVSLTMLSNIIAYIPWGRKLAYFVLASAMFMLCGIMYRMLHG